MTGQQRYFSYCLPSLMLKQSPFCWGLRLFSNQANHNDSQNAEYLSVFFTYGSHLRHTDYRKSLWTSFDPLIL